MTVPSSGEILMQLNRILASEPFRASDRLSGFLDYTVRKVLSGEQDQLKESLLAIELFGRRGSDFDSRGDTVVRVNATRLRDRLDDYYRNQGVGDLVRIVFPRGSYVPVFERLTTPPAAAVPVRRNLWLWATAIVVGSAAAILAIFFWPQAKPDGIAGPVRFQIGAPGTSFSLLENGGAAQISPDGRFLVFAVIPQAGGPSLLWTHALASGTSRPVPGTEGARYPFWSPDGQRIAFFQNGKLRRTEREGGAAQTLCEGVGGYGGTWSAGGQIVFASSVQGGLSVVPASGGQCQDLTVPDAAAKELGHLWPSFLPDGRNFLYWSEGNSAASKAVWVASLDQPRRPKRLFSAGSRALYARLPSQQRGILLYMEDRNLLGVRFDADSRETIGSPVLAESGVGNYHFLGLPDFSVSSNGVLSFRKGTGVALRELAWYDRSGSRLATRLGPGLFRYPAVSPDGKTIAVEVIDPSTGKQDIWLAGSDDNRLVRFTLDGDGNHSPVWAPDQSSLVYGSATGIWRKSLTLSEAPVRLTELPGSPTSWSRDQRLLFFDSCSVKTRCDVYVLEQGGAPRPVLTAPADESDAQISPDGRWLAYVSIEDAAPFQVFVEPYPISPGSRRRVQVSRASGATPRWCNEGRELYFQEGANLMAVDFRERSVLVSDPRMVINSKRLYHRGFGFAVDPKGSRFLFSAPAGDTPTDPSPITIVLNRFIEWPR